MIEKKPRTKKPTNGQLLKRLESAILHIDKTKDTQSIFFTDKGLRLIVNEEYAIIETGYHRHVFNAWTAQGFSRPYAYTKRIIAIATENDCETENGYSYAKLREVLKGKNDNAEYNIVTYYEWYVFNCAQPLYAIGENTPDYFLVYEAYLHNIACNTILLTERTEDMTNKQFFAELSQKMQEFTENMEEFVVFHKKTDEEVMRENAEAELEQQLNETMEVENDGSKD